MANMTTQPANCNFAAAHKMSHKEYIEYYEKALEIYRSLEDQNPEFYTKKMERIKDAMQE